MNDDSTRSRWFIATIFTGLLVWAGVLAWGVVRNQIALDVRKPLVIIGVVVLFLGVWAVLLLFRKPN